MYKNNLFFFILLPNRSKVCIESEQMNRISLILMNSFFFFFFYYFECKLSKGMKILSYFDKT